MIVFSRLAGEGIAVGRNCTVQVVDVRAGKVRLGIEAPSDVPIIRQESCSQAGIASPQNAEQVKLARRVCKNFHAAARRAQRDRHANSTIQPLTLQNEYDVQELLHIILSSLFDDVRREERTPSFAGKSSTIDFLLAGDGIAIEVKMTRRGLETAEKVGDQLLIDIGRYQVHPKVRTLIFLVYDPSGHLDNPMALENDLTRNYQGLPVIVIVVPKPQ